MDRLEIVARAWTAGANVEGLNKVDAIRAIQCAEGFAPCFGRGQADSCGQYGCAFREDCASITVISDPCEIVACDTYVPKDKG